MTYIDTYSSSMLLLIVLQNLNPILNTHSAIPYESYGIAVEKKK